MATKFDGDVIITGRCSPNLLTVPPQSVGNSEIAAGAGIDPAKLGHYHQPTYAQPNTAAADETRAIYVAHGAGIVEEFSAGSLAKAVGDATCTVDLKKNGSSILSAVITLDSGNTNRVAEAAVLAGGGVTTYADGDLFEVVIDGTIGTGTLPTGVFCGARFNEAA